MSDNKLNAKDLQGKSETELNQLLIELRKEQFSIRLTKSTGQEVKNHLIPMTRKNIARVKTVLNSKTTG